ncbi:MAG: 16S rRNA processing protein RimM [Alphaproteobacteria bacterium]|nr:16S rRNA processing protein RimM [Alphaproteobacteria bacterium]
MTPGSSTSPSLFCAAVVASAHGVHGHVKVKCFLENPTEFNKFSPYCNKMGEEAYRVKKILSQKGDMLIVSLEGVSDRTYAEQMRGTELFVPRSKLPTLSEDIFYHRDLIGLQVHSHQGVLLGDVHALYNFGAGDILEIKTSQGKLEMLPFTKDCVPEVHNEEGTLVLSPEGETYLTKEKSDA